MIKLLKVMVLGISVFSFVVPAYAQDAAKEQGKPDVAQVQTKPEPAQVQTKPEPAQVHAKPEPAQVHAKQEPAQVHAKQEPARVQTGPDLAKEQPKPEPAKDQAKQQASKELIKGLDEQVQEIKTDVLGIAAELNRLEEKLLYPSDTQIAIFVSLAGGEKIRLDAVDIALDGKEVTHHLYTFKELEALQKGGVQRIHVGNIRTGEHPLHVTVAGKTEGGSDFHKEESFKITKGIGPKLVGVVLAGTGIGSKTITVKDW